jgi:DNA-binding transcriptional LysR family regulator
MNIRDIDWKSLLLLEALVTERNVSKVAKQFGMSQPAVSNSLARMRELFNDPLLMRTREGMLPTARAEQLLGPIRQARRVLEQTVTREAGFDPAKSERRFTVAATDYAEYVVMPRLTHWLSENAPGIHIELQPLKQKVPLPDLESGQLEIAIGYFNASHASLYQKHLFTEEFVCLIKAGSGRAKGPLTIQEYADMKHVLVAPWGGKAGLVDALLAKKGLARNVCVTTPHFLMAPWLVAESGYACTLPRGVANAHAQSLHLEILELPFTLPPLPFRQLWHERVHNDPGQVWLRSKIAELTTLNKGGEKQSS